MGKNILSVKALQQGQIATQSLWNNEFIHTKSESLYDESLVSKGITTVSNLFDNEGELKNWQIVSQEFNFKSYTLLKVVWSHKIYPKLLEENSERL